VSAQTGSLVAPQKVLGIFGGMGPEATANLYQEIVRLTPAKKDQDHIPTLIFSFPQVPDRTASIKSGDRSIIPYLVEGVTRLERSGASFIVIPCNTAHYFYDDMQRAVKIPILHMIRATAQAVKDRYPKCRRVGLLATNGTIGSGLYHKELRARGMEVVCPGESIQNDCVMKAVYAIKAAGDKRNCEDLLATAGRDVEQKGAEVIVLGCTEIPLAFNPQRASVPVVSATRVLAEAAIREFFRERRKRAAPPF
jgi:aspartate racemase